MMFISVFKRVVVVACLVMMSASVFAQEDHFIYLQTENSQPFYVKINNTILSSSTTGYVILPAIKEGQHEIVVGFPKNEIPEGKFDLEIKDKNVGYLIKNLGSNGLSLFNLQTLALIDSKARTSAAVVVTKKIEDDAFSTMLAGVVDDSSLLVKNVPVVESPVKEVESKVVPVAKDNTSQSLEGIGLQKDSSVESVSIENKQIGLDSVQKASKDFTVIAPIATKPSVSESISIKRVLLYREKDGLEMIYVDKGKMVNDTVRIFLPVAPEAEKSRPQVIVTPDNKIPQIVAKVDSAELTITPTLIIPTETPVIKLEPAKEKTAATEIIKEKTIENVPVIIYEPTKTVSKEDSLKSPVKETEPIVTPKVVSSSKVNSDCKKFANNDDFLRLRKKMAAEINNDDMIQIAKKEFKAICFSTEQIKNLSYLFLNDEGKYMFFDAAYAYTSDSDQYITLQAQLSDEYYVNRFKAMLHK
ncbi:MAG: hypothetical protein ABIP35_12925 [Ginsengibacter sp.]